MNDIFASLDQYLNDVKLEDEDEEFVYLKEDVALGEGEEEEEEEEDINWDRTSEYEMMNNRKEEDVDFDISEFEYEEEEEKEMEREEVEEDKIDVKKSFNKVLESKPFNIITRVESIPNDLDLQIQNEIDNLYQEIVIWKENMNNIQVECELYEEQILSLNRNKADFEQECVNENRKLEAIKDSIYATSKVQKSAIEKEMKIKYANATIERKADIEIEGLKTLISKLKIEGEKQEKIYKKKEMKYKEEIDLLTNQSGELSLQIEEWEKERIAIWDKQAEKKVQLQRMQNIQQKRKSIFQQQQKNKESEESTSNNKSKHIESTKDEKIIVNKNTSSIEEDDGEILQSRVVDGKKEVKYKDGRRLITFKNGTTKEVLTDNSTIVRFINGDIKHTFSDSTVVYIYFEAKTTHTTYPDGVQLFDFPNGQKEKHYKDGRKDITFPDGTVKRINPDDTSMS